MSRYPPGCKSLIGGHLLLLDSSGGLRGRSGNVHRRWYRMGPGAYMCVLLVERLAQVLSTAYHGPAGGTSAPATAAGTQVSRMPVVAVGVTRMSRRTHHLALPTKGKTRPTPSLRNSHASFTYWLDVPLVT